MFTSKLSSILKAPVTSIMTIRNKGSASDPIQKLFLEKIREYRQKTSPGEMVEPSPAILRELKAELSKLEKNYGGGSGVDMAAFPTFKFEDPKLDPIDEALPDVKQPGKGGAKKRAAKKGASKKGDPKSTCPKGRKGKKKTTPKKK